MWGGGGSPGWLTISNSHFGGNTLPGCSDGIQIGGDGAKIGPGNEFTGKFQGNCVAHSDPIQFYAPSGVNNNIVTGNWFHDNTTGCMCWGGGGDNDTFTNNVFESIGYWSIVAGSGENNWLIAHNVFGDDVTMDNGHSPRTAPATWCATTSGYRATESVTRVRGSATTTTSTPANREPATSTVRQCSLRVPRPATTTTSLFPRPRATTPPVTARAWGSHPDGFGGSRSGRWRLISASTTKAAISSPGGGRQRPPARPADAVTSAKS